MTNTSMAWKTSKWWGWNDMSGLQNKWIS